MVDEQKIYENYMVDIYNITSGKPEENWEIIKKRIKIAFESIEELEKMKNVRLANEPAQYLKQHTNLQYMNMIFSITDIIQGIWEVMERADKIAERKQGRGD